MRFAAIARTIGTMTIAPSTPTTVAAAFLDTVARTPDQVALIGPDATYTWAELHDRVARTTARTASRNPATPSRSAAQLARAVDRRPRDHLRRRDRVPALHDAPAERDRVRDAGRRREAADHRAAPARRRPSSSTRPTRRPSPPLIYTSGTTARPKGVELTHASLLASVRAWQDGDRPRRRRADHLVASQRPRDGPRPALLARARPGPRDHHLRRPARDRALSAAGEARTCSSPSRACGRSSRPAIEAHGHLSQRALGLDEARIVGSGAAPIATDVLAVLPRDRHRAARGLRALGVRLPRRRRRAAAPPIGTVGRPHAAIELKLAARRRDPDQGPDPDARLPRPHRVADPATAGCTPATSARSTPTAT